MSEKFKEPLYRVYHTSNLQSLPFLTDRYTEVLDIFVQEMSELTARSTLQKQTHSMVEKEYFMIFNVISHVAHSLSILHSVTLWFLTLLNI